MANNFASKKPTPCRCPLSHHTTPQGAELTSGLRQCLVTSPPPHTHTPARKNRHLGRGFCLGSNTPKRTSHPQLHKHGFSCLIYTGAQPATILCFTGKLSLFRLKSNASLFFTPLFDVSLHRSAHLAARVPDVVAVADAGDDAVGELGQHVAEGVRLTVAPPGGDGTATQRPQRP